MDRGSQAEQSGAGGVARPNGSAVLRALNVRATGTYRVPGRIDGWGECLIGAYFVDLRVSRLALDTDGGDDGRVKRWEPTHQPATSYDPSGLVICSDRVPYVVLPGWFAKAHQIPLGAVCAVLDGDQPVVWAMFADYGPKGRIGEASIRVHELLGARPIREDGSIRDVSIMRPIRLVWLKQDAFTVGGRYVVADKAASASDIANLGWQLWDSWGGR